MKKFSLYLAILTALLIPSLGLASQASAVNLFSPCKKLPGSATVCQETKSVNTNPIITVIKDAMEVIAFVTGAAAIILVVVSGIRFIVSGGDANAVAGAKNTLIYALVGVAVTALAQSIIVFILDKV